MSTQQATTAHEIVWTIVVAGGSGQRFGGPKQYESLGHQRVLDWSVQAARAAGGSTGGVVLVVPAADAEREGGVAGGARSGTAQPARPSINRRPARRRLAAKDMVGQSSGGFVDGGCGHFSKVCSTVFTIVDWLRKSQCASI